MSAPGALLPRFQQGARSQQLLAVLLGDYWFARSEPIPSAALVDLLAVFGVGTDAARGAIQRLAQRGFLVGTREGRHTAYAVPRMSRERIDWHVRVLFLSHLPHAWDGSWTIVGYSVPEDAAGTRRVLRDQLRQHRFGSLYDAMWIRPGAHADTVAAVLAQIREPLDREHVTVFTGARLPAGTGREAVAGAFRLATHAARYREFLARWERTAERLSERGPESILDDSAHPRPSLGDEALRVRTSIMTDWRMLRRRDPHLPRELLDADYPLDRAVQVCAAVYDPLGPVAESAFRRVLAARRDDLADLVSHHTFAAAASLIASE